MCVDVYGCGWVGVGGCGCVGGCVGVCGGEREGEGGCECLCVIQT
jgi:hypothetical protein